MSAIMAKSTPIRKNSSEPLRRASTTLQDVQEILKTSTDRVLQPTVPDAASHWNSIPLAFAMLPAVAGVFFTNGSVFVTDVILLLLTAVFLHWLIKFPWEWYHESRALYLVPEETTEVKESAASRELRFNERLALAFCFLGPVLGGCLLHAVRNQLSRPGESLLSTFNITVFVLGAELRPFAQVVGLIRGRCAHLHRRVHSPPATRVDELGKRVEDLEGEMREMLLLYSETFGSVKGIQPDLDALNRAVRRYEKKEAATETRFGELDRRLNDVLTLAAAASAAAHSRQQQPLMDWIVNAAAIPLVYAWKLLSLPARVVESAAGNVRRSQAILRNSSNGASIMNGKSSNGHSNNSNNGNILRHHQHRHVVIGEGRHKKKVRL